MTYGDYEALVAYDEDADLFHGEVMNLRDVITFQGRRVCKGSQAPEQPATVGGDDA
jgi:predicted HicB family RNase H-like nuclease